MTILTDVFGTIVLAVIFGGLTVCVFWVFYQVFKITGHPGLGGWAMLLIEILVFDTELKQAGVPLGITAFTGLLMWATAEMPEEWRKERDERRAAKKNAKL